MGSILNTTDLTKVYRGKPAVDKLNLDINKGEIYGFLGRNGAGKTTTIRMMMGLIGPTSGEVCLFGQKITKNGAEVFDRVGAIIEKPGFYGNLSAWENLDIHRRLIGLKDKSRISWALETVGLKDIDNRPVQQFSLGMKQRLGIARAIIHRPELLILDEPSNGLDPIGIREVRQLIRNLAQERGITIFMSSHILNEIEQIATRIGLIDKGRLIDEIDYKQLQSQSRHYLLVGVSDLPKSVWTLEEKLGITDISVVEDSEIRIYSDMEKASEINRAFVTNDIEVSKIELKTDSLEDYFLRLTGGESGEADIN